MDLFEYQGKELFSKHGVPVPDGKVASSPKQVRAIAEKLGGTVVVKAQVQVGGRGKAGGIKLAKTPDEAVSVAEQIIGLDIKGHKVKRVLVERAGDIKNEFYASFLLDRAGKGFLGMVSSKGGVDIEEVAATEPDAIAKVPISALTGLQPYHLRRLVYGGGIPADAQKNVMALLQKLFDAFVASDASLVEVNPLVQMGDGSVIALDAKVSIDDNAIYRQAWTEKLKDVGPASKQEKIAAEKGLNYVKLDGKVGIIGNGAGLTMSTLDVVAEAGGTPANFLDIGGGANAETMAAGIDLIFSDKKVKSLLVNIFGGITRCDLVAQGILEALQKLKDLKAPIVVRLDGTNADQGRAILEKAGDPRIVPQPDMLSAARKAVELSKGKK
ncbi:MAG TPA: ADP-forming succinate--CoA ligase subunit beta [Actinomycetota bacterium]|nr:ADP-forming succinate--CoA ligase subunit beta [Actinomycetota bacterium]